MLRQKRINNRFKVVSKFVYGSSSVGTKTYEPEYRVINGEIRKKCIIRECENPTLNNNEALCEEHYNYYLQKCKYCNKILKRDSEIYYETCSGCAIRLSGSDNNIDVTDNALIMAKIINNMFSYRQRMAFKKKMTRFFSERKETT